MKRCKLCKKYNVFDSKTRRHYLEVLKATNRYNEEVLDELCIDCLKAEFKSLEAENDLKAFYKEEASKLSDVKFLNKYF